MCDATATPMSMGGSHGLDRRRTDHELIMRSRASRQRSAFEYTLKPRNEVPGYAWKTKGRVTITKKP